MPDSVLPKEPRRKALLEHAEEMYDALVAQQASDEAMEILQRTGATEVTISAAAKAKYKAIAMRLNLFEKILAESEA